MDNFFVDQAEGLRRMIAAAQPCVFTFISANNNRHQSTTLLNLAASMSKMNKSVLFMDANTSKENISAHLGKPLSNDLSKIIQGECQLSDAIYKSAEGFSLMAMVSNEKASRMISAKKWQTRSEAIFDFLKKQYDYIFVDAMLGENNDLPLSSLDDGEVIIQVSDNADSIKSAYSMIKRLNSQLGRRPFSILVTGTTEIRAKMIYQNISKVASRYLAVPLVSMGYLPNDECVERAAKQGRSVIDAFPTAGASLAFQRLADNFAQLTTNAARHHSMARAGLSV